MTAAADHHLLFGLLALHNGLIDQGALVAAFQAWTRDKARSLADHLVARGDLDANARAGLDAIVALHIEKHGDVERSLGAVPAGKSTRESLARLGDPDIDGTLNHVASGHGSTENGDVDRTALREALAIRARAAPDDWARSDAMSLLGESLLGQGRTT
jgi:hypothetical protein